MSCLAQDGTGDLLLTKARGGKNLTIIQDKTVAAAQKLTNRFLLFLGEWYLDTRIGLPFFQLIAVKNPDLRVLKQLFTKVVLSVPPIVAIEQLDVTLDSRRQARLSLRARTDTGAIITGGEGNAFIVANPGQ